MRMRIADWMFNNFNGALKERFFRYAIGFFILLVVYLVLLLFYIYPHWPIDLIGWAILILVGIPLALFLELISEFFFNKKTGQKISDAKFSIKRILIVIMAVIIIFGVLALFWYRWSSVIQPHFK